MCVSIVSHQRVLKINGRLKHICLQPHVDPIAVPGNACFKLLFHQTPHNSTSAWARLQGFIFPLLLLKKGTVNTTVKLPHTFLLCLSKRQSCRSLQVRHPIQPSYRQVNCFRQYARASRLRCEHLLPPEQQKHNVPLGTHSNPHHLQQTPPSQ
jgi:hypothetical protein